ncbi:MAG: thioredoxin family protein [Chitinophagales bacterium]|nr:thioredoxin family protein [Chitinophagales bacterium]
MRLIKSTLSFLTVIVVALFSFGFINHARTPLSFGEGARVRQPGYNVGDYAADFKLKNIDDKMVSLADYTEAIGFVVVFTCNHCPYAKLYEDRLVALDKVSKKKGYPVIAINPNDAASHPEDSFDNMKKRAKDKGFTFPYLVDETQEVAQAFGAAKTPHVYLLQKEEGKLKVVYIGAIDDDTENTKKDKVKYVENAIDAVEKGEKPNPDFTKAVGCTIKWKS